MSSLAYLEDAQRTSLTGSALKAVNKRGFQGCIRHLERYHFWGKSRRILSLWPHQKSAIALGAAYLNAERSLSDEGHVNEAALIKLPTGAGKSGVIAVLTRCLPKVRRALVLTPRTALTEQLQADIEHRFWRNIGFDTPDTGTWDATAEVAGAALEPAYVEQLLPNRETLAAILEHKAQERVILVGTFQALDEIRRTVDQARRQRKRGQEISEEIAGKLDHYEPLMEMLSGFDLIVVDEGHYEPAPSWSRSVRALDLPTILLSATPFRNDYKLFRVRGRFVYNMQFDEARGAKIIRSVEFPAGMAGEDGRMAPPSPHPAADEADPEDHVNDSLTATAVTEKDRDEVRRFVDLLQETLPAVLDRAAAYTDSPKVIVRAGSYDILQLLQADIEKRFQTEAILIHERVDRTSDPRQFKAVRQAQNKHPNARFWLHETKLLEGIDDPTYVAVALFDPFGNHRQLVQQIGRVIRSTDKGRRTQQHAAVIARTGLREQIEDAWARYLEFEAYCSRNVARLVQSEAAMPERVMEHMPDLQYVDGEFRHRYLRAGLVSADHLQLPLRASVFIVDEASFDPDEAEHEIEEAIIAEDRFRPQRIEGLPDGLFGRAYYAWRNSPFLKNLYLAEWTLGICVGARIGKYLFVQDTGGIAFQPEEIDVRRASRETLLRAFPHTPGERVVLTRMSAHSLDMSDRAIRTQSTRTRSFAATFTDLLDPSLVPTSVYGFVGGTGRYLGIARGRISDASDTYKSIPEFHEWIKVVAAQLADETRQPHEVFERYAKPTVLAPDVASRPVSILLDLTSDALTEFNVQGEADADGGAALGHDLAYHDLCADIEADGKFVLRRRDGQEVSCKIEFVPKTSSYRIKSKELNELHPPRNRTRSKRAVTLTKQINSEQAFRVLTPMDGVVYMRRGFYETRDMVTPGGIVLPLEDTVVVKALRNTTSEKGEKWYKRQKKKWKAESIFGVVKAICDGEIPPADCQLANALADFDLLLLDDGGDELGDFIAVGDRRVAFIHAKAATGLHRDAVTALQAVGRQAVASLAFCSTQARVDGILAGRWKRDYVANKEKLNLSRLFKDPYGGCHDTIDERVKAALRNPSWSKEIWIVAGRLINLDYVRAGVEGGTISNHSRQLLMFLESLRTSCARGNARLRLFGHGDEE